ncbi:MAG: formylglycine-generating enzyme family protein [Gammaproteobacteria bacterium]|nr:formylglycine-generating enzyme family protein [Gammaproteobacteria bacterium]
MQAAHAEDLLCKSYAGLPSSFPAPEAGMRPVPAGQFIMGSDRHYPEERPQHNVSVAAFLIDTHEVTNAEFAAFVAATGYITTAEKGLPPDAYPGLPDEYRKPGSMVFGMPQQTLAQFDLTSWWQYTAGADWRHPGGPHTSINGREAEPVTQVSWDDAKAYAVWRGHDLPTESEWEWAARGGSGIPSEEAEPNANIWEGIFPYYDSAKDGYRGPAPVGCFKPNGYGLFDMLGNVWEWTQDDYQSSHDPAMATQPVPGMPNRKVIKGGSWLCSNSYCGRYRPSARQPGETDLGSTHIGFRTIMRPIAKP